MSTCPFCGEKVPFGGGKTAKNAAKLFDEVGVVKTARKALVEGGAKSNPPQKLPEETLRKLTSFIVDGERHAMAFHAYAHKRTMVQPDWAQAGWWSRHAQELVVGLARDLGGQP